MEREPKVAAIKTLFLAYTSEIIMGQQDGYYR